MSPEETKRKAPQATEKPGTETNKYVMPGLVDEIVWEFRRKKGVIPHARTIAMNRRIESGAVYPALIYALFEKISSIDEHQSLLEGRIKAMSVREYQSQFRRAA